MSESPHLHTSIGTSTADAITVREHDLANDLMGRVTFTELAFLLVRGRMPSAEETRMLDAVLVSLADHGLTPTVLAARLTYTGAPESLQGAVAAGLLGAGSVFLGVVEDTARLLDEILESSGNPESKAVLRMTASRTVQKLWDEGHRVPGLGHPVHREEDPRTTRIYALAEETGLLGPHLRLLRVVAQVQEDVTHRHLPINGAGVAGAALADLGFDARIVRGFALLARTAGLVAHLAEEMEHPLGMALYRDAEERVRYEPPTEDGHSHSHSH